MAKGLKFVADKKAITLLSSRHWQYRGSLTERYGGA